MSITVTSPGFKAGDRIPTRYSQDGENLSPPLTWAGVPADATELALTVDDPDAPGADPFVHWVLYGLAPEQRGLPEGVARGAAPSALPKASQGPNDYGHSGYDGPKPPPGHGVHHYHFTLYAVGPGAPLPAGLDKAAMLKAIAQRVVAQGELVGTYER